MANEPIEVESIREERTCTECGQPSGVFDTCKKCDYEWLQRMRRLSE